jgi:hypothetical protein
MTDNKYEIDDLLTSTAQMKPVDFEDAFNDIVTNRIRAAIEDRKVKIAQQLYNYVPGQEAASKAGEEPETSDAEEWEDDIKIHKPEDSNNGQKTA